MLSLEPWSDHEASVLTSVHCLPSPGADDTAAPVTADLMLFYGPSGFLTQRLCLNHPHHIGKCLLNDSVKIPL